jgi:hypothetical protein
MCDQYALTFRFLGTGHHTDTLFTSEFRSRDIVDSTQTRLWAGISRVRTQAQARYFSFLQNVQHAWGPTQPPSLRVWEVLSLGWSGRYVKLTSRLHLVSRFRMSGVLPPLHPIYVFIAWTGTTLTFLPLSTDDSNSAPSEDVTIIVSRINSLSLAFLKENVELLRVIWWPTCNSFSIHAWRVLKTVLSRGQLTLSRLRRGRLPVAVVTYKTPCLTSARQLTGTSGTRHRWHKPKHSYVFGWGFQFTSTLQCSLSWQMFFLDFVSSFSQIPTQYFNLLTHEFPVKSTGQDVFVNAVKACRSTGSTRSGHQTE